MDQVHFFNYSVNSTNDFLQNSKEVIKPEYEIISSLDDIKGYKEKYHCIHSFEYRDNITGYEGLVKFFDNIIPFDFDDSDNKNIENSHKDALDFTAYLDSLNVDYAFYFSGNRGFHVELKATAFGYGIHTAEYWQKSYSNILNSLKKKYKTLDPSLASRIKKFRSFNSKHSSTKLYKIRIDRELKIDQILKIAEKPSQELYTEISKLMTSHQEIKELSDLKNFEKDQEIIKFDGTEKDRLPQEFNKLCISKMIQQLGNQEVSAGNRHRYFLNVVKHFYNNDRPFDSTMSYITGLADACFHNDKDKNDRVKEQQRAVKEAYSGKLNHNIGCYSKDCFELCEFDCPVYKTLDVVKRKQFDNLSQKKQQQVNREKKEKLNYSHYRDFFKKYEIIVDLISEIPFIKINDDYKTVASVSGAIKADAIDAGYKKNDVNEYLEKYCLSLEPRLLVDFPKWEGKDFISKILDSVELKKCSKETFIDYFKFWGAGIFRRINDPFYQNIMPILKGGQGIGKDFLVNALLGEFKGYFKNITINERNQEKNYDTCSRLLVASVQELDKLKGAAEIMKELITTPEVFYRTAYGNGAKSSKFRVSLIGTCNTDQVFHDHTGARRFAYFDLIGIHHNYPTDVSGQVIAQFKVLCEQGYSLNKDSKDEMDSILKSHLPEDLDEHIYANLYSFLRIESRGDFSTTFSYSQIESALINTSKGYNVPVRTCLSILKKKGITKRTNIGNVYSCLHAEPSSLLFGDLIDAESQQSKPIKDLPNKALDLISNNN